MSKKKNQEAPKNTVNDQWKTIDLAHVMAMDLTAAISLLTMIRDTPEVYDGCLRVLEQYRKTMILRESQQVELDKLALEKKLADETETL